MVMPGAVLVFVPAAVSWYHQGWQARLPGTQEYPAKIAALVAPGFDSDMAAQWRAGTCFMDRGQGAESFMAECIDDRDADKLVFLWGDSHAAALYPGLLALAENSDFGIAQFTANSCPPALAWQGNINSRCRQINEAILTRIEQIRPAILVLQAAWYMGEYAAIDLAGTLQRLKALEIPNIVVIGPPPLWADNVPYLIFEHYRETSEILAPVGDDKLVWSVIEKTGPAIHALTEQ